VPDAEVTSSLFGRPTLAEHVHSRWPPLGKCNIHRSNQITSPRLEWNTQRLVSKFWDPARILRKRSSKDNGCCCWRRRSTSCRNLSASIDWIRIWRRYCGHRSSLNAGGDRQRCCRRDFRNCNIRGGSWTRCQDHRRVGQRWRSDRGSFVRQNQGKIST
jgi:hypothetical protein